MCTSLTSSRCRVSAPCCSTSTRRDCTTSGPSSCAQHPPHPLAVPRTNVHTSLCVQFLGQVFHHNHNLFFSILHALLCYLSLCLHTCSHRLRPSAHIVFDRLVSHETSTESITCGRFAQVLGIAHSVTLAAVPPQRIDRCVCDPHRHGPAGRRNCRSASALGRNRASVHLVSI